MSCAGPEVDAVTKTRSGRSGKPAVSAAGVELSLAGGPTPHLYAWRGSLSHYDRTDGWDGRLVLVSHFGRKMVLNYELVNY